ncbi:MAG: hypothetical protein LBD45_05395 [Bacteroidales bacterium]|jgi:hypothetical protein|nr:hypothetical protein [Bacteroidales bacterium]
MKNEPLRKIRLLTIFFIVALVLSGLTAFPLVAELRMMASWLGIDAQATPETYTGLKYWIALVNEGLSNTSGQYPFLMYGTDWLAFAHIVIAVAFIGLYREPVRNKWIIYWGMIACTGIVPLAFICGTIREIPFYWQLIDCSFGIFGIIPLYFMHVYVKKLENG